MLHTQYRSNHLIIHDNPRLYDPLLAYIGLNRMRNSSIRCIRVWFAVSLGGIYG